MGEHLAYGDIIRIYCTLQDSQDKNQKSGERSSAKIAGFLMSKGFADNNIYFLKSKKFTEFEFRNSLFEILPYSSFEIHDENKEREKNRQKGGQPGQKSMDDQNRKSRMDTEKEQFLNKINKNKGLNINFDSEIVIRHVNSESFLQGEFSCPETGIGSFKLVLTNQYSSLIKFKIIRFRNSDKEAEEIQSKDEFRLFHCASHCFLNIGNQEDQVFLDKLLKLDIEHGKQVSTKIMDPSIDDIFDQGNMFHGLRPIIKKPTSTTGAIDDVPKRFEVVNQSKATLILNFMPQKNVRVKQRSEKSEDGKGAQIEEMCDIEHNDVVYLKNTKNDSFLSVDLWSGDVYLKKQKKCFEGLWEICVKRQPEKGGIVSNSSKTFYLKHYITDAVAKVSITKPVRQSSPQRGANHHQQYDRSVDSQNDDREEEQQVEEYDINKNLSIKVDPKPQPRGTVMRLVKYPNSKGSLKHRDLVVISVLNLQQGKQLQKSMHDVRHSLINEQAIEYGKHFIDIAQPIKKIRLTSIQDKCQQNLQFFKLKLSKGDIENTFQIFKFDQKKLLGVNKILSSQEALIKFCDILIVFNKMLQRDNQILKKRGQSPTASQGMMQSPTFRGKRQRKASISLKIENNNRLSMQDINTSPKEQPIEQYINRYLNSYILMTICNTTKFLKDNCKTGNKAEFDFMIMIRSFGVIEILVEMIYFIETVLAQWDIALKSGGQSNISKRKYEKDRLLEIFKEIYQLLTTLSSQNSCKTYMARWLKLFLKQYYKLKKEYMHEFILKVLDDSFIVKSCIEKDNISECLNNLRNTFTGDVPDQKYLQLLSSFCKCKNEAVPGNQDFLIKNFLKYSEKCVYRFQLKTYDMDDGFAQDRKSSAAPKEDIRIITKNKHNQETSVSMADHGKFRKKELWSYTVTLLNLIAEVSYDQPLQKQIMYTAPDVSDDKDPNIINVNVVSAFFKNYREEDDDSTEVVGKSKSNNIFQPFLKLAHFYIKEQTDGVKRLERNESVIVWSNNDEHEGDMVFTHNLGMLFDNVTSFFLYLFQNDLKLKTYNIKKLKTIETALDFIKTLMKTKSWNPIQHNKLIEGIRLSVLKLKPSVIYAGVDLKQLQADMAMSRAERERQEKSRSQKEQSRSILGTTVQTQAEYHPPVKEQKQTSNIYKDAQKLIQKNYKKLVDNKQYIRLLIDTRRLASQILDIHLDIINNERLSILINEVFLRLYQNNFETGEESTDPYSHRYRMNHPETWVKQIKDKCQNGEARLKTVRCLIECFFVDSLKVVDKMLVLMFKMYESRKNLLNSFSKSFICYEQFFVNLYNEVKEWMAGYEKMKPNGNYDKMMLKLQKFSYCIRNPISTTNRRSSQNREAPTPSRSKLMDTMDETAIKQDMRRYEERDTLVLNEIESRFNQRQEQVQKMLINTKIHEFVMKYAGIVKPNLPQYKQHLDIVFEFMTLLVFDNLRNKKEVTSTMLKFCQKHLRTNYKAIDFLMEMIRNNKAVLSNKQTVTSIAKTVLEIMAEKDDYLLKAKLMDVLRMCCIQNNLPHPDNQTIVMNLLQNKNYFQKVMFETDEYERRYELIFGNNKPAVAVFEAFAHGMMNEVEPENEGSVSYGSDTSKQEQKQPELIEQEILDDHADEEESVFTPSIYRSLIDDLAEYKTKYSNIFTDFESHLIEMSPLLQYMTSYFSMMCSIVEGNHAINVGKCSNIHKYESLLLLLRNCQTCWPLAKYVRGYINRLYYGSFSDKQQDKESTPSRNNSQISIKRQLQIKAEFFVDKIFQTQLPLFNDHLEKCTQYMYDSKNLYYMERTKILKPFRYEYIVSYMYMFMMETLEGLKNILGSKQYKQAASDKLKTHENADQNSRIMLGLLRNLGEIYKRYRHMTEQSVMKKIIMELFEHCLTTLSFMDSSRLGDIPETRANVPQLMPDMNTDENTRIEKASLQDKAKYLIKLHFFEDKEERGNKRENNEDNEEMFNEEYKTLRVTGKTGSRISNSDHEVQLQINLLLESVIDRIKDSPQIKQMAEEQLNQLVELCCNLNSRSDVDSIPLLKNGEVDMQNVTYSVITENVFLTQLIKLITKSPDHLKNQVKIKGIRFLRLIFEKKVNSACKLDSSRWESSYFKKGPEKETLEMYQKQFLNLKLGQMIVKILETKNASSELLQETFMLGARYLFNGYTKCQQSILEKLRQDSENEVMTQLCQFIRNIRNEIEAEKFKMEDRVIMKDEQNKQQLRPAGNLVDSYNFYDKERNCMIQARVDREKGAQSNSDVEAKIRCVCYTFNFLQLLCQNDNTDLKQFLRQQTNPDLSTKYNSVNFLAETTKLFKVILEKMPDHPLQKDLIKYIAEFLIEVTMIPCITNQRELCNTTIFQDITGYIHKVKMQNSSKLQEGIVYLMDFVINVGLSLLQGNEDSIYDNILKALNAKFLRTILEEQDRKLRDINAKNKECPTYTNINAQSLKILMKEDKSDPSNKDIRKRLESIFNLLALVKKLSHYQKKKKIKPTLLEQMTDTNPDKENAKKAEDKPFEAATTQKLCAEFIEHIEVAHNGKKQFLYFPKLPIFDKISSQTTNYIHQNVKRDTQIDKITDFLSKSQEVNNQMSWNYKVLNRLGESSETLDSYRFNITLLTIAIEIIFIVCSSINFTLNKDKKEVVKMIKIPGVNSILHFLAIIQLFSSMYFLYVWVTLKYRLAVEREQQKSKTQLDTKVVDGLLNKIDKDQQFDLKDYWECAKLLYEHETEIFNTLFFIMTSLLGYLIGYQYYSLMVFDVLARNKILKNVIQAITLNMKQLFYVSLLILVFVYVFNMISVEFDLYLPYIYEAQEEKCQVLSDCIMSLYTSGIVGTKDQDLKTGRYFTDLIYIVIMELLFSNIVSGIMIDTFAQLRDHRKTIEADKQNQCFICGISKATIEKRTKEAQENFEEDFRDGQIGIFEHHTRKVHIEWNYIYYLYMLKQKDITAYTGIEYAIKKQMKDDQYKWVPIEYEKNENDVEELLELLSTKLKNRLGDQKGKGK